ncbi:hypothetical protein HMPREF3156_02237 [Neisseria sp. HMSC06F02]|nr:hypothetical protein HMPREF3156_02237 [Neisseria sp. HMSC06F02]
MNGIGRSLLVLLSMDSLFCCSLWRNMRTLNDLIIHLHYI